MTPEAEVVRERDESFHMLAGPHGYEKVGIKFNLDQGGRVIWFGCRYWPVNDQGQAFRQFQSDERFAMALAAAWNKRNDVESVGGIS